MNRYTKREANRKMVVDDIHAKVNDDASWMVDTGATHHLVRSEKLLQKNQISDKGFNHCKIKSFSGQISVISVIGYAYLHISSASQQHIVLRDVLYVPNSKYNLVSVALLTMDYPFSVIFDSNGFLVKDLKTKKEVAKGDLVNRSHYFWSNVMGGFPTHQRIGDQEEIWKGVTMKDDAAGCGFLVEYGRKLALLKELWLGSKMKPFQAWVVDSGADKHFTYNAKLLRNLRPLTEYKFESDFEGRRSEVTHVGDVHLPRKGDQEIILREVRLVPHSKLSIISVSQFISDHPACCFEFTSDGFVLKSRDEKNKVMARGPMLKKVYWWLNKRN